MPTCPLWARLSHPSSPRLGIPSRHPPRPLYTRRPSVLLDHEGTSRRPKETLNRQCFVNSQLRLSYYIIGVTNKDSLPLLTVSSITQTSFWTERHWFLVPHTYAHTYSQTHTYSHTHTNTHTGTCVLGRMESVRTGTMSHCNWNR